MRVILVPDGTPGHLFPTPHPRCGTEYGYKRHRRHGEVPCGPCRVGNTTEARRRADAPAAREKARAYRATHPRPRMERPTALERFMTRVQKSDDGCWPWTGGIATESGYGRFWVGGRTRLAHIAAYELMRGPVPEGCQVDHQCHNRDLTCDPQACAHRRCVNPDHLDVVPPTINQQRQGARKTHCPKGHEYTPENTERRPNTNCRSCRECHRIRQRAYTARKAAAS